MAFSRVISLPMHTELSENQQLHIINHINKYLINEYSCSGNGLCWVSTGTVWQKQVTM